MIARLVLITGLFCAGLAWANVPRVVTTSGTGLAALTVTNFWDGLNRPTGAAFPDGTTTSNVFDRLYLGAAKDRLGYWTYYGYDNARRLQSLTSPAGGFGYFYDPLRSTLLTTITLPNAASITNHYDLLARLDYTGLINFWGHVLDGYSYGMDPLGLRTNITRNLGLTTNTVGVSYDSIGQLASWSAKEGLSGPLRLNEQYNYVYDKAGNLWLRTNGGLGQTFNCDALNQLTNITRNAVMTVSGATPAPATNITVNGQPAQTYGDFTFAATNLSLANGTNTFTIIAQNAYGLAVTNTTISYLPSSISLAWDSNGNLTNDGTRSFAYSPENQLINITVPGAWRADFVYDGLGRRRIETNYTWQVNQWVKTNELHFIYDGYLPIQVRDGSNNVLVTYTRGLDLSGSLSGAGGIGGLLARTDGNGSTFYHADGAGNITGLMDGQQNMAERLMFDPFGKPLNQQGLMAGVDIMGFSSMPQAHGIVFYPGRPYLLSPPRWGSRDPLGIGADSNPYRVNYNNPLSYIDPDGMAPQLTTVTGDLNGRQTGAGYVDYHFGQDYGIGLNGPLNPRWDRYIEWADQNNERFHESHPDIAHLLDLMMEYGPYGMGAMGEFGELGQLGKVGKSCPPKVFRAGKPSPSNLKPRPGEKALSFRDSLSNPLPRGERPVFRPGDDFFGIDTSKLPEGSVIPDNNPLGHVSVQGVDADTLKKAVIPETRGRFPE